MSKIQNPANEAERFAIPADFQPMSLPTQKLSAPERPGWHRHWFRGDPARIALAQKAYYQFVNSDEVGISNRDLGGDASTSGSTDMGTRVSVVSGDDIDHNGQPGRMYLMECREELFEESQRILGDRNESIAAAIRGGLIGQGQEGEQQVDISQRYMKGKVPDLFTPKRARKA